MSKEKYGFNGKWLFVIGYNSRIGYEDVCKIAINLQAENAELKSRKLKIADHRHLEGRFLRSEITASRLVELINEHFTK